jgi:hypothetical protein
MSTQPTHSVLSAGLFNIVLVALASNQTRKNCIQIGKEQVKLSLLIDNIILYVEIPRESTQKLFELIVSSEKKVVIR